MPLTAPQALERFRRRLRAAAFVKGAAVGLFAAAALCAAALLGARLGEVALPTFASGSALWAAVAAVGLLAGLLSLPGSLLGPRVDDDLAVEHLEARLGTDGLLLAAVDGVELEPAWRARLERHLERTDTALPGIAWRSLWLRPCCALLVLGAMQLLPPIEPPPAPVEAASIQVQRLAEQIEQLAQRTQFDGTAAAELREQVGDLQRRVAAGETGVWRDLDQLAERVDRERRLAGLEPQPPGGGAAREQGGGSAATSGGEPEVGGAAAAPEAGALANGLEQLAAADPDQFGELLAGLPEGLQEQVAAALGADGNVDPERLPADEQGRDQLGAALGEAAKAALEGLEPQRAAEMADQLAGLAQEFLGGDGAVDTQQLTDKVAEAASQLTDLGLLEAMPEFLQEALLKAAIETGLSGIQDVDLDKLKQLLPDDLSELEDLARKVAELAEGASGGEQPSSPSLPDLSKLAPETKRQLAGLAEGLREQFGAGGSRGGGSGGDQRGGDQRGGEQSGGNQAVAGAAASNDPGAAGPGPGDASALAGAAGGHDALRMTEQTEGGGGTREFVLPGRDPVEDPLPGEWTPVSVEKAAPEVAAAEPAGPGSDGATAKGTPTWQLRLMPRHRDVVRRFFADKKKKQ
ncbi:MAG: hypothetical protein ACE37K_23500 [Planctomycetota bacterium]